MSDEDEKDKSKKKRLFHYTSKKGIKGIMKSGQINPSVKRDGDVIFGEKVYMNDLEPEKNTSFDIAKNNYDGTIDYAKSREQDAAYALAFDAEKMKAKRETSDRSIYTVEGPLPLNKVVEVHKIGKDGKYKKIEPKQKQK